MANLGYKESLSFGGSGHAQGSGALKLLLHGSLVICVNEAKNLPAMEGLHKHMGRVIAKMLWRSSKGTTSAPYVTIALSGAVVGRTFVISNNQNPIWKQHFDVPVAHYASEVHFVVKHNNVEGSQIIGSVGIPVEALYSGEKIEGTFPILNSTGHICMPGVVLSLSIQYTSFEKMTFYNRGIGSDPDHQGVPGTYFPLRRGGKVTLYQDAHVPDGCLPNFGLDGGFEYKHGNCWQDIFDAVNQARRLIYITGWSLYHKVTLVRDNHGASNCTLGDLLKNKSQEGVRVLLLVWDDPTSRDIMGSIKGGLMKTDDVELRRFFKNSSVQVLICPRSAGEGTWAKKQEAGIIYTHHQKTVLVDTDAGHSKRKIIAFVGGLDLCLGRYDTPEHPIFRTLQTVHKDDNHNPTFSKPVIGCPREPWHDLHSKIDGPAAYDILTNFEQRWGMASKSHGLHKRKELGLHKLETQDDGDVDDALLKIEKIPELIGMTEVSRLSEDDIEAWDVQVFRSIDSNSAKGFPEDPKDATSVNLVCGKNVLIDMSIHAAYVKAIRAAQHFIYIENQYFLGSSYNWNSYNDLGANNLIPMEIALKIVNKIKANEKFSVYIVIPMWPEGDPTSVPIQRILLWQHKTMQMMYEMIYKALKEVGHENTYCPQDYLNFFCLGNRESGENNSAASNLSEAYTPYALTRKNRRFMIYVHSKGMIVDDEYVIIGSANINQRSMEGTRDTEIAMGAYQPHHTWARKLSSPHGKVYGYRMSLWAEHIGLVEECFKQPKSLECVQRVRTLSEQNWSQYIANEVTDMKGHLLKYPVEVSPTGKVEPLPGCAAFPDVGGYILGIPGLQFTELTGDFETTGDVRSMASPQPKPAPVKNDVLSGFGMEDTSRGIVAHSDHELESTGISRTFRDEDHFEKGVALPSTSPVIGQKNDEFLNTRGEDNHRGFVTHLGHETQNTDENHLEEEIAVPSTSPPSPAVGDPRVKYDVFLSFRGEDTRKGFIAYLYRELQKTRAIKTFKDDAQLKKGTVIASNLLRAIEESRFAIIVFSEKYADSAWCLDELTKIFQCMEGKDTILPIFYQLDPAVVRYQKKETSFGEAFVKHEARQDIEKTNQWRAALKGVAGISGWNSNTFPTEVELIDDIVKHLLEKVLQAPTRTFGTFEATGQVMDEVMKVLKDDQVTVLGVHGVAGVGKTTMVKHVGAQAEKDGLFDRVIMVVISKSPDLQEIQGTLADSLGLKEGIKRGDRMLIILDDIWESFELSGIGIPSHHELQNCYSKVVIITRNSNVCHSMGCHAEIALNILSDEDSWKLLKETSGKSFDESANSYDEERKVAQECRGLPRAIKAAARSLGDKYRDEWNEAVAREFGGLEEWNEAAQAFNLEAEKGAFHSLEDTYHSLESDDAKSCFLLCCLFPENYDIPIEELLKYGIGIGLFQYDSMQEARDRAHSVVKYLKASRLLLEGTKEGCVRMTDDIRNLALSKEGDGLLVKASCELEEWPDTEAGWWQGMPVMPLQDGGKVYHEGYSIISLMRNKLHKLPEYLVCSKLQILLLQSNAGICDIPETFLQSPSALRVFDLSFTSISSLPQSFSFLTSLQALNLDFCSNLSEISVLGNLKKLEILSMRELPLKNLPKQIGNLTSLRKLDVTGRYLETIPSKVLSKLCRLEELHMKFQFGKWGSKIEDASEETNANFDELTGLLDLNILEVYISDATCLPPSVEYFNPNWVEFDICISRDVLLPQYDGFSRTLTLDTTINSLPDWFISVVTAKVEQLEYTNCDDLNDLVGEYDHGRLILLKYLSVNGHHKNLKEIINTMRRVSNKPVFENLEELHLHCLYSLEELCVGELPPGSLRKLKLLKVQTCHSLVNALLSLTLLPRLRNLEKIICVHLDRMKYVFGSDEGGVDPEKIFLRKLREMRLCALEDLVRICNGPAPHAIFQNLKVLAICECKELKSLFTIDVAECLFQLEDLCIEQCPRLDRVIEASNSLNSEITLPALKRLALIDLPVLTRFCTESGNIETRCRCPSLEYLYVENCIKFSYYANFHFSKKQIHFNDQHHLSSLVKRWKEMHNQL